MEKNTILLGKSTIFVDGRNIGYTEGGVAISMQSEELRFSDIDQISGDEPMAQFNNKAVIKFTTPTISLANLILGWDLNSLPIVDPNTGEQTLELSFGAEKQSHQLVIATHWLDGRACTIIFDKVYSVDKGELAWSKKDHAKLPITLESVGNTSDSHGRIIIEKDL